MTNRGTRIMQAMRETSQQLEKAMKRYNDSITCLKMDIAENGSNKAANRAWVDYCNEDKARVKSLQAHMRHLEIMLEAEK